MIGMNKQNSSILPNTRLDQIYGYIQNLSDVQLQELVKRNPDSMEATLALGYINAKRDYRDRTQAQGKEPQLTVRENIVNEGIAKARLPEGYSDAFASNPAAVEGVGSIGANPVTERNSMDTPMDGIARLPTPRVNVASGGIIGFAGEGDSLVEGEEENWYDNLTEAGKIAAAGLVLGKYKAAGKLIKGAGKLAQKGYQKLKIPERKLGEKIVKKLNPPAWYKTLKPKPNLLEKSPVTTGVLSTLGITAGLEGIDAITDESEEEKAARLALEEAEQQKARDTATSAAERLENSRLSRSTAVQKDPYLGRFLQGAGLSYASGKNLGESGIAGLKLADEQKAATQKAFESKEERDLKETYYNALIGNKQAALLQKGMEDIRNSPVTMNGITKQAITLMQTDPENWGKYSQPEVVSLLVRKVAEMGLNSSTGTDEEWGEVTSN